MDLDFENQDTSILNDNDLSLMSKEVYLMFDLVKSLINYFLL